MKRVLLVVGLGLVILLSVMVVRTLLFTLPEVDVEPLKAPALDETALAQGLSEALRFKTISSDDPAQMDHAVFDAFHGFLAERFPRIHETLNKEVVNEHSLLYTWPGQDPSLEPVILMAHHDVVPAPDDTLDEWKHSPFEGAIADGYVWGRGALDNKSSLMGIMEAVEALLREGHSPKRTVYLVSGHDEELGGWAGTHEVVALLESRGVKPLYVLDEGGAIISGTVPGVAKPIAAVGYSEKGYVTLELTVKAEGGHSSTPPAHTAVGILSQAITRIEANPFPSDMKCIANFFACVGPAMEFPQRMVFANMWATAPLVRRILAANPSTAATLHTTTAATMFNAGIKENVLPSEARAVVNFRILPGDTVESVKECVCGVVDDDRVQIEILGEANEPSVLSDIDGESYDLLAKTIRQAGPEGVVVAPYLTLGATDARHFCAISDRVYRFLPISVTPEDLAGIHGTNERVSTANYLQVVRFYCQLLVNTDAA